MIQLPARRAALGASVLLAALAAPRVAQVESTATAPFPNFESGPTRQLLVSADGARLLLLNTRDHRLEVFGIEVEPQPGGPAAPELVHEGSVFTGLEPVAMALDPASPRRVFVSNLLSDTVSVVDVPTLSITATLHVGDEPRDIEVVGGKLYVACARSRPPQGGAYVDHAVVVRDAAPPFTHRRILGIDGLEPRSLCSDGSHVYAVPMNSGNETTLLKDDLAESLGITQLTLDSFDTNFVLNPLLTQSQPWWVHYGWNIPQAGRIVFDWEYPQYVQQLDDRDVRAIDRASDDLEAAFTSGVGTTLFAIERNPVTGELWVANTDANNRTRMEYNLKGKAVVNQVSILASAPGGALRKKLSLEPPFTTRRHSQPHAIAFYDGPAGQYAYVATLGSASVVILDAATESFVAELDTGEVPGDLAVDTARGLLFVYSRGDKSVRAYDIAAGHAAIGSAHPVPYDAEPPLVAAGRRELYDARIENGSGNGAMSCASCHVFGHTDEMAWDLGNSQGGLSYNYPDTMGQPGSGYEDIKVAVKFTPVQNPMKGPLVTQTLRGLPATHPFHWRGDRRFLQNFQPAFAGLNGGPGISDEQMQSLVAFLDNLAYPPNPHQDLDRVYKGDAAAGLQHFGVAPFVGAPYQSFAQGFTCGSCHEADLANGVNPTATHGFINEEAIFQAFNPATMRGIHEKSYRELTGFGTHHDGALDGALGFLEHDFQGFPSNDLLSPNQMQEIAALLESWDAGMAPLVGQQARLDHQTGFQALAFLDLAEPQARLAEPWLDVVAKGWRTTATGRIPVGATYRLDPGTSQWGYQLDDGSVVDRGTLVTWARRRAAVLTFTAVPAGMGVRLGIDRDEDGLWDHLEVAVHDTSPTNPDSDGDGYADGDDLALGGDPASPDAGLADGTAPGILEHSVSDLFVSSGTISVVTDEPTTLVVDIDRVPSQGAPIQVVSSSLRKRHLLVASGMEAGVLYRYVVRATDRNGNTSEAADLFTTVVPHLHVSSIELERLQDQPVVLQARFTVVDRAGNPVSGVPVEGRLVGDIGPNQDAFTATTNASGVAVHTLSPYTPAGPSTVTVGLDYLGSLNVSHPYFVGFGGGTSSFYYEQAANAENYESVPVF